MVKKIIRDQFFLAQKSEKAAKEDLSVAQDLLDTMAASNGECVGMAANMIGVSKRVIVIDDEGKSIVMFNPEIVKQSDPYDTVEGCMSLDGLRPTKRWKHIKVKYENEDFQTRIKSFSDWTAEIIQHEIDHCNGILI